MYSGSDDIKGHWWISIIFGVITLHSLHYLSGRFPKSTKNLALWLVNLTPKVGMVLDRNFLLPKTNVSDSELKATSLISIHIWVTKSSTNDCSKAEEEDIGQVGKLPGDTSVSSHSHSRHHLTALMTLQ